VAVEWRGFLLAAGEVKQPDCLWATRVQVAGGVLYEIAGTGDPAQLDALLPKGERVEAVDRARGSRRLAVLKDGKLAAALFVTREGLLPSREWLIAQIGEAASPAVLAGAPPGAREDRGPIVCLCFDVGLKTIVSAVASQQLTSVEAVGAALSAGTNCGSCRPAIRRLIEQNRSVANA
jgi:assimilatory nitrate reductase catalytic subunit